MLDRSERLLKIGCLGLAAMLIWQISQALITANPLANLTIPAVPTLPDATNAATANARPPAGLRGTNSPARGLAAAGATNGATPPASVKGGSNSIATIELENGNTNGPARRGASRRMSNSVPDQTAALLGTNAQPAQAMAGLGTNAFVTRIATNQVFNGDPESDGGRGGDALAAGARGARRDGVAGSRGMDAAMMATLGGRRGGPGGLGGAALPDLPPTARARVERIYLSQLLGPITPPVPASLLGIAGDSAILRGTNGQTGWVKEGDLLGGIKLLKIGVNRVLIDEGGQKKELTIFPASAAKASCPNQQIIPNETITHFPAKIQPVGCRPRPVLRHRAFVPDSARARHGAARRAGGGKNQCA